MDSPAEKYHFNHWTLDINSRALVTPNNEMHRLPRSEFRAMLHLVENPGRILTRAELLAKMTGRDLKSKTVQLMSPFAASESTLKRIQKHLRSSQPFMVKAIDSVVFLITRKRTHLQNLFSIKKANILLAFF